MPKVKDCYIERDVSWMYFNHRILEEAEKEYIPLLERVSFLGIYSNNLDEFFRVRVASLNRLSENRHIDKQTLEKIRCSLKTINKLNATYAAEYTMAIDRVESELRLHGIRLLKENELNEEQQHFLTELFYNKLNGSINPIWLSEIKDLAVFEDNRIYLAVEKTEVESQKKKYAIVKVPVGCDSPNQMGMTTLCTSTMWFASACLWSSSVLRRAPSGPTPSSSLRMPRWTLTTMPTTELWRR